MMVTLALLVCLAAIFCFFAQEFNRVFKRIFDIKGIKLFLPLALGSWLVYNYDFLFLEVLYFIRDKLNALNEFLIYVFPNNSYVNEAILIFILTVVSVGPVILLHVYSYRKTNKPFAHPYSLSTLIWIICAILLVSLPGLNQ